MKLKPKQTANPFNIADHIIGLYTGGLSISPIIPAPIAIVAIPKIKQTKYSF